jgi:hypothetical protein
MSNARALLVALLATAASGLSSPALAQQPPPVTGTRALEGTMKTFYKGLNRLIVVTIDGVEHAFRFTKELVVPGQRGPDPFAGLREGTSVAIYYQLENGAPVALEVDRLDDQGFESTEGMVQKIDRGRRRLTIRFDNGRVEQLDLTERAVDALAEDALESMTDTRIRVFYTDESGRRVVHYFKRAEKK